MVPVLANSSNNNRAWRQDISVHSKHHILSLKSKCSVERPKTANVQMSRTVGVVQACQPHFAWSRELSANVLSPCFAWGECLNKFSVEMYLVIFWKLPNFIFRLTPHNVQALSSMHAITTRCHTIAFTPIFHAKLSVLIGWFNWDQLRSVRW